MDEKNLALEAIRKKLVGKPLSYKEIYAIMDQIAEDRLGQILTTYFVASGYSKGFSSDEIYYLTRAMVETGEKLHFQGVVADKHSIGGTPGTRTTMILVPIIAAAGFKIPKSSSRAITTPAGTADSMEVLAKVTFKKEEIYDIVSKTNGCIVWGGSFKIAPADDEIIRIEEPLMFESYDKILVSVMAKKIAFGSTHVIIDLPYGTTVKVHRREDADLLAKKFLFLAKKFNIKLKAFVHKVEEPAGNGIGPLLEAKDALKVLEQTSDRPLALEERALHIAGMLLELCIENLSYTKKQIIKEKYKTPQEWAKELLVSGKALAKMKGIIREQKGNPNITSDDLKPAKVKHKIQVMKKGKITQVNNKNITLIAKLLGAPEEKDVGLLIHKRLHEYVEKDEDLITLYSNSSYRIKEALDSLELFPVYEIDSV